MGILLAAGQPSFSRSSTQAAPAEAVQQPENSIVHGIELQQGWNMISSFVLPDNLEIETLMTDIEDDMLLIKNGSGRIYWPDLAINQIGNWDAKDGYQIYMIQPGMLFIPGTIIDPVNTIISLPAGWSLVAYLRATPMAVGQALSSVDGQLFLVKDRHGRLYWPDYGINQIGDMQPGEGYQMLLSSQGRVAYPDN